MLIKINKPHPTPKDIAKFAAAKTRNRFVPLTQYIPASKILALLTRTTGFVAEEWQLRYLTHENNETLGILLYDGALIFHPDGVLDYFKRHAEERLDKEIKELSKYFALMQLDQLGVQLKTKRNEKETTPSKETDESTSSLHEKSA